MGVRATLQPTRDDDRVRELLGRVEEKLGQIPQAYQTLATNQNFLNDTLYNIKRHLAAGELDIKTKQMIAIAVAAVTGGAHLVEARVLDARADGLTDDEISEALAVAGSISTFNTFYKFQHLAGEGFDDMMPGYKLSVFLRPAVLSQLQVELVSAVVSVVNGCQSCVRGHVAKSTELGASKAQIEEAIRVGALVAGIAAFTNID